MTMPVMERLCLAPDYTISRVIKGGWQLAGEVEVGAADKDGVGAEDRFEA